MERNRFFSYFVATATVILGGLIVVGTPRIQNNNNPIYDFAKEDKVEVPVIPDDVYEDILAPDGTSTLILQKIYETENMFTQVFSIVPEESDEPLEILVRDSSDLNYLSVPFNTFSPTNKYVFLKVNEESRVSHIVLRTDGDNIVGEDKYVEVESRFYEKYGSDFDITAITGWGGNGLLVINTDYANGRIGPSFWFDLSNFGFIRLSNRFN